MLFTLQQFDDCLCAFFRTLGILASNQIAIDAYLDIPIVWLFIVCTLLLEACFEQEWNQVIQLHGLFFRVGESRHSLVFDQGRAIGFDAFDQTNWTMTVCGYYLSRRVHAFNGSLKCRIIDKVHASSVSSCNINGIHSVAKINRIQLDRVTQSTNRIRIVL